MRTSAAGANCPRDLCRLGVRHCYGDLRAVARDFNGMRGESSSGRCAERTSIAYIE